MPKTISTSDETQTLSTVIGWVVEHGDEVIVESDGAPRAVIMSFADYERVRSREQGRDAIARLRQAGALTAERNRDLTEADIEGLANRFAHDFVDDLATQGKATFERDAKQR